MAVEEEPKQKSPSSEMLDKFISNEKPHIRDKKETEEERALGLSNDRHAIINQHLQSVIELREKYALRVYILVSIWMAFVGFVILSKMFCPNTYVSEEIIPWLLGSATISMIGLLVIILKNIFPHTKS